MNEEVKYQVFISSTYKDLVDERKSITKHVISLGFYPVGMEHFNLGNDSIWEHIKRLIEGSDYYVLLLGSRYGTIGGTGLSYTQQEYEYAKKLGKPIKVLMLSQTEIEAEQRKEHKESRERQKKLQNFRDLTLKEGVEFWSSREEFQEVISKIGKWIDRSPAEGWVRGHVKSENQVLRYLFNSSNSLKNLEIDDQFISSLPSRVHDIADVVQCIDGIRQRYLMPRLPHNISVFFTYRVSEPRLVIDDFSGMEFLGHYRMGLSSNKKGMWRLGRYIGNGSNVHYSYESGQSRVITDTESPAVAIDQRTVNERGYCVVPVFFNDKVIGNLGISSQNADEVQVFTRFVEEAAIAFSSVFIAFAENLKDRAPSVKDIRALLDCHFAASLPSHIHPK